MAVLLFAAVTAISLFLIRYFITPKRSQKRETPGSDKDAAKYNARLRRLKNDPQFAAERRLKELVELTKPFREVGPVISIEALKADILVCQEKNIAACLSLIDAGADIVFADAVKPLPRRSRETKLFVLTPACTISKISTLTHPAEEACFHPELRDQLDVIRYSAAQGADGSTYTLSYYTKPCYAEKIRRWELDTVFVSKRVIDRYGEPPAQFVAAKTQDAWILGDRIYDEICCSEPQIVRVTEACLLQPCVDYFNRIFSDYHEQANRIYGDGGVPHAPEKT